MKAAERYLCLADSQDELARQTSRLMALCAKTAEGVERTELSKALVDLQNARAHLLAAQGHALAKVKEVSG